MSGCLDKGMAHCRETGTDPEDLTQARLYPDMLPLSFQIELVNHHSLPTIEGCKTGFFKPPPLTWSTLDYAGLQRMIADTVAGLETIAAGEINTREGRDVGSIGDRKVSYTVENSALVLVAEFLFSCRHGLRHPAQQRRENRQKRFPGRDPREKVKRSSAVNSHQT